MFQKNVMNKCLSLLIATGIYFCRILIRVPNKEIKSLNAMLVTEEKRNNYSLYLLKNLLVDIYNKYCKLTDSKYIELNSRGGVDGSSNVRKEIVK